MTDPGARARGQPGPARLPALLSPMMAVPGALPSDDAGWAFEMKWDGVRALAFIDGGQLRLASRTGRDITVAYPELAPLAAAASSGPLLLDGEVVAFEDGRPSFAQLQPRMHVTSAAAAARLSGPDPRLIPDLRRAARSRAAAAGGAVRGAARAAGKPRPGPRRRQLAGPALVHRPPGRRHPGGLPRPRPGRHRGQTAGLGLPAGPALTGLAQDQERFPAGVRRRRLAARAGRPHRPDRLPAPGRARPWRPGLRGPRRHRLYRADPGPAGQQARSPAPGRQPFRGELPREHARGAVWVQPLLVIEAAFALWTPEGRLRAASYQGLRDDKDATEVIRES